MSRVEVLEEELAVYRKEVFGLVFTLQGVCREDIATFVVGSHLFMIRALVASGTVYRKSYSPRYTAWLTETGNLNLG
jgi:hypothetical protein